MPTTALPESQRNPSPAQPTWRVTVGGNWTGIQAPKLRTAPIRPLNPDLLSSMGIPVLRLASAGGGPCLASDRGLEARPPVLQPAVEWAGRVHSPGQGVRGRGSASHRGCIMPHVFNATRESGRPAASKPWICSETGMPVRTDRGCHLAGGMATPVQATRCLNRVGAEDSFGDSLPTTQACPCHPVLCILREMSRTPS